MRIIVSFNGGGLTINFEGMTEILDQAKSITLCGHIIVYVNAIAICETSSPIVIRKEWLLAANEVYLDTRIEEDN